MNGYKKNTAARLVKSFRNKLRAGNRFLKNAIPYDSEDVRTSGTPLRSCLKNTLYYSAEGVRSVLVSIGCFFDSVRSCVRWFPIIWRDRDFDYHYLLTIMRKKLELMEEFFASEDTVSLGAERLAAEIGVARALVSRMEQYEYACRYVESKKNILLTQGYTKEEVEAAERSLPRILFPERAREPEKNPNIPVIRTLLNKAYLECSKYESEQMRQDMEYFGKYVGKRFQGWWD